MQVDEKIKDKIMSLHVTDIGSHFLVSGQQKRKVNIFKGEILEIKDNELWKDIGELLKDRHVDILLPKDVPSKNLTKYDIIIKEHANKDDRKISEIIANFRWKLLYDTRLPSLVDYYRFCELYNILVGKGIYIHYDNIDGKSGEHIDEYIELLEKFRDVYEGYLKFKPALLAIEDSESIEEIVKIRDEYEADM